VTEQQPSAVLAAAAAAAASAAAAMANAVLSSAPTAAAQTPSAAAAAAAAAGRVTQPDRLTSVRKAATALQPAPPAAAAAAAPVLPVVPLLWPEQQAPAVQPLPLPALPLQELQQKLKTQQQQQQHQHQQQQARSKAAAPWQQPANLSPATLSCRRALTLLRQVSNCKTCWDLSKLVKQQNRYTAGLSDSEGLQVPEGWTADVTAAAMLKLRETANAKVGGLCVCACFGGRWMGRGEQMPRWVFGWVGWGEGERCCMCLARPVPYMRLYLCS
jgi:hypothetical protein